MKALERYLYSTVYHQAPDAPGAGAGAGGDPAPAAGSEGGAARPAAAAGDGGGAPAPSGQDGGAPSSGDGGGEPKPHGNAGKTPWYMQRINEETNKKNEERVLREAAEKRARDAEELLARLQRGEGKPGEPGPSARPAAPAAPAARAPSQGDPDFQQAVRTEAANQRLYEDSVEVLNNGLAQFADFNNSRQILGAVGALDNQFLADLFAVDKTNAHVILDKLAKDPERAQALVSMDSRRRTAELVRMSMADGKGGAPAPSNQPQGGKPAAPVSRAPAPKPAVEPSGGGASPTDWQDPGKLDKMTEEEANRAFSQGWNDRYLRKSA